MQDDLEDVGNGLVGLSAVVLRQVGESIAPHQRPAQAPLHRAGVTRTGRAARRELTDRAGCEVRGCEIERRSGRMVWCLVKCGYTCAAVNITVR
jgi:hypothetical protein